MSCGRCDKTAMGVSDPIEPIGSFAVFPIGRIMVFISSRVYPKTDFLFSRGASPKNKGQSLYGMSLR